MFAQNRGYEDKGDDGVVETGDRLGLSFVGTIDGKPFAGGSSDHAHLTVGSGEFIPGFEEQLVGMKKGETREVEGDLPRGLRAGRTARQEGRCSTSRSSMSTAPKAGELNDEFAKTLGLEERRRRCARRCAPRWAPRSPR